MENAKICYSKKNAEKKSSKIMKDLANFIDDNFLVTKKVYQLLMLFNEVQEEPLKIEKISWDFISSLIFCRTSLFSKQISYDKKYLEFLINLTDIHCYEVQYKRFNRNVNDRVEDIKYAFLTVSLDYKKDMEPYYMDDDVDLEVNQMLERTLSIILYKTYFPQFWEKEYFMLKQYNPILAKILINNKDYLEEYNQRRKEYYYANYEYKDIAFELEQKILLMVWTTMLEEYPSFKGKEYILSLVMMRVVPNLSTIYEMISNEEFQEMEDYISYIISYCRENTLKLYLH